MRVRGLKPSASVACFLLLLSHPVRVRGLKRSFVIPESFGGGVAPRAGAWIETSNKSDIIPRRTVAPRAGAWIETESKNIRFAGMAGRTPCGCVD